MFGNGRLYDKWSTALEVIASPSQCSPNKLQLWQEMPGADPEGDIHVASAHPTNFFNATCPLLQLLHWSPHAWPSAFPPAVSWS